MLTNLLIGCQYVQINVNMQCQDRNLTSFACTCARDIIIHSIYVNVSKHAVQMEYRQCVDSVSKQNTDLFCNYTFIDIQKTILALIKCNYTMYPCTEKKNSLIFIISNQNLIYSLYIKYKHKKLFMHIYIDILNLAMRCHILDYIY